MKSNYGAAILFGQAKAHLDQILYLIERHNEIAEALRCMGYTGEGSAVVFAQPEGYVYDLELTTGNMNVNDASLLDEAWEYGPSARPATSIQRSSVAKHRDRLGRESGWKCFYCSETGTSEKGPDNRVWHVDHTYPVSRGGDSEPDNLVLACATCNLEKKAQSATEYFLSKRGA